MKLFEKMTIVLLLKTQYSDACDTDTVMKFITSSPDISPLLFQTIESTFEYHQQVYERHVIPLLLCENPKTDQYSLITNSKKLLKDFNAKILGSCKSIKSVEHNVTLFN